MGEVNVTAVKGSDTLPLEAELTIMWELICALFVLFMQTGFALLEAGTVRPKNVRNILLKNALDALISTICWWSVGWAFSGIGACGQNGFIGARSLVTLAAGAFACGMAAIPGYNDFFLATGNVSSGTYLSTWIFSWTFSATAGTIVSGAVAERMQFKAYAMYTILIASFVYPVVAHWVWSPSGWLSATRGGPPCGELEYRPYFSNTNGLLDYAGSGVVHTLGGGAALMGAIFLGPRLGRFNEDGTINHFEHASPSNMTLGVFILWLGWYGFNTGSTRCFQGCMSVAAKVAVNTTLSVGSAGLVSLALAVLLGDAADIAPLLNGVLVGAVSITASCALVQPYAAFVIGIIGGCVYTFFSKMLLRLRVDDPLDAAPVHFFCGIWGLLASGFFATETDVKEAYGYANDWGVFYGGGGRQLGMQVLGALAISGWTCTLSGVLFLTLRLVDWLRVPKEVEVQGLDFAQGLMGRHWSKYGDAQYFSSATRPEDLQLPQQGLPRSSQDPSLSRRSANPSTSSRTNGKASLVPLGRSSVNPGAQADAQAAQMRRASIQALGLVRSSVRGPLPPQALRRVDEPSAGQDI